MIEHVYKLYVGDDRAIEKVIFDDNVHYLHMVFKKGDGLPDHYSNSTVYMTVVRGQLFIRLNAQDVHEYNILN